MIAGQIEIQMMADVARLRKDMGDVRKATGDMASSAERAGQTIKAAFAGIGLGFLVREFITIADAMSNLDSRLKLATKSTEEYEQAQRDVYRISQTNKVGLQETTTLYARMADPIRKLGGDTRTTATITEAFGAALRISGATTAEASSATIQFSQAMASGVLRGEEFNSVNEAAPRVMQALEASLGKTRGELRKMAEQGLLTSDVVGNALVGQFKALRDEAATMPMTVGAAMQLLQNDIAKLISEFNRSVPVTQTLASAVQFLSTNLTALAELIVAGAKIAAAYFVLFNGGALAMTAYAAAVSAATAAKTVFLARAALVGPAIAALSIVISGATTASFALAAGFTAVQVAGGLLFAAFAGWQIGSWLRDNFIEAELAGIALVNGLLSGWELVKLGAGQAWAYIGAAWRETLDGMGSVMGWFLDKLAGGLTSLGLDSAAEKMRGWAAEVVNSTSNTQSLSGELTALDREYAKNKAQIDAITGDMADYAIQTHAAKGASVGLTGAVTELTGATNKDTEAKARAAAAAKAAAAAEKELQAAAELMAKTRAEGIFAVLDESQAIAEQTAKLQQETAQMGLSKAELRELERARIAEALTTAEASLQTGIAKGLRAEELDGITLMVEELRKLRDAKEQGWAKEIAVEAKTAAVDTGAEWKKISDQIGQGLTDSLFRAFEAGGNFFSNFWDGIKNLFKTTVLRLLIQPVQNGINNVVGGLFSSVTGGGGSGGGGLGSLLSAGSSAWNYGSSLFGAGGGGVGALASNAAVYSGAAYGTGFGTSQSAMLAAQEAGMASSAGTSAAGSMGMTALYAAAIYAGAVKAQKDYAEGYTGQYAMDAQSGLGLGNVGSMTPEGLLYRTFAKIGMNDKWASILSGATATGKILDLLGLVRSHHSGSVVAINADGTASTVRTDSSRITDNYVDATDQQLRLLGGTSTTLLNGLDSLFGGAGGFSALMRFAADGKDPSIGSAVISRGGVQAGQVGNGDFSRYNKNGAEGFDAFIADVAGATRQAIDAIDLPKWAKDAFGAVAADADFAALAKAVAEVTEFQGKLRGLQTELAPLGGIFASVATLSSQATFELTEFAGGIEAFAAQAAGFVRNYYSADEQAAIQARSIFDALGAGGINTAGLDTRDEFRGLVESRDLNTEEGRRQLAILLGQAEAFAQLSEYLGANGSTLDSLAGLAPTSDIAALMAPGAAGTAAVVAAVTSSNTTVADAIDRQTEAITSGLASVAGSTQRSADYLRDIFEDGSLATP